MRASDSTKSKLDWRAGLGVMALAAVLFHLLWSQSSANRNEKALAGQVAAAQTELTRNQAALERLTSTALPEADGISIEQYLKTNERASGVVNGIVNHSRTSSFAIKRLSLDEQSLDGKYHKNLYSLEAEAAFIDIGKFLEELENSALLTEISSFEISRIAQEMKRCRAKIKLFSYVRAP